MASSLTAATTLALQKQNVIINKHTNLETNAKRQLKTKSFVVKILIYVTNYTQASRPQFV